MGNRIPRAAVLALLVLLLASPLAAANGSAPASSPTTYTLVGYVQQPGGSSALPVGAGVSVVLTSSATHQSYSTTTTTTSGQFVFSSSTNAPSLSPGWWGLRVPPQSQVSLAGGVYTVLPQNQSVQYFYLNSTQLTSSTPVYLRGVALDLGNTTVNGTVTFYGAKHAGALVQLLAPDYDGFVVASNTSSANTTHTGYFTLANVPWGNWILETTVPGVPPTYDIQNITINAVTKTKVNFTVNPALNPSRGYLAWGYVNSQSSGANVPNGGNVTVFDPASGAIWSNVTEPGGFYSVGSFGTGTFDVILSTVGYETVWYRLNVTPANPTGGANPKNVKAAAWASPPANYSTDLTWSPGFGKLNITTAGMLANDTVFPDLANASVGQLWAQLALDWQHNLSFSAANLPAVAAWMRSAGPFFPAGEAGTTVNGTTYGQPTNYSFAWSSTCAAFCGLNSAATMQVNWAQNYNLTSKLSGTLKSYSLSFNFRHPTHGQSFNYTVHLPKGYVLAADAAVPNGAALEPAGPGGTWTNFTLVAMPSTSSSGTFNFQAVKIGTVSAAVNVTAKTFTWSARNLLNTTHNNYTVAAGADENLTFTGVNSTFSAGTNGTLFKWVFGDGHYTNTSNSSTNHTYHTAGVYQGSLTLLSSGGVTSSASFRIWVGNSRPTAVISVNDTAVQTGPGGIPYVVVNWSTSLQFNASASSAPIGVGGAPDGSIAVAAWNISDKAWSVYNYTASAGGSTGANEALGNVTKSFLEQGPYVTQPTANGSPISLAKPFYGWQYNVSLVVWSFGGLNATARMVVLVKDTQKPVPLITLKGSNGQVLPAAGVTEGKNLTAYVKFTSVNSTDPGNGSIVWYNWSIGDTANTSANFTVDLPAGSGYAMPSPFVRYLTPQSKPYTVNLTVTDRAGNKAWTTSQLTVAVNTSTRPVIYVTNLTAPSTMTGGTTYTIWANVTNLFGQNSTAVGVQVHFYLLPPDGTGSQITIGGSPSSVTFYNVTNGAVNATPAGTGTATLKYNQTVRAEIRWDPSQTGTWELWANGTAANEFAGDYGKGNLASTQVTLNPNPIIEIEEIVVVVVVAAAVIVGIVVWYRRFYKGRGDRLKGGAKGGSSSGGSSGGSGGGRLERGPSKDDD